ncbi:uncharacterized protein EV422DRAFT_519951, partial [Fimicolochytrium jonesii]|uniref:uncharacterized protein n=1 Tax=Fimicolochytrium jonesii TaxID=1396493 RepID=UPI0022FE84B6
MRSFTFLTAVLGAAAVQAQNLSVLFDPSVSQPCQDAVTTQITNVQALIIPCGLINTAAILIGSGGKFDNKTLSNAIDSSLNPKSLDAICSDTCTAAINNFGTVVAGPCANQKPLLSPSITGAADADTQALLKNLGAADISPILNYLRKTACVKNGATYCAADEHDAAQRGMAVDACTPCAKAQYDASVDTSSLPAYAKPTVDGEVAKVKTQLDACPADKLSNSTTTPKTSGAIAIAGRNTVMLIPVVASALM